MSLATIALLIFVAVSSFILLGVFSSPLLSIIGGIAGIVYCIALIVERR